MPKAASAYTEAVGRRKTSTARVRLSPAKNTSYTCNKKSLEAYFPVEVLRGIVRSPFEQMTSTDKYEVTIVVKGGGIHSQAEAVRHGIARALSLAEGELRKPLKALAYLTRDSRAKERRKFGLKKARKAPQWSKR
ncbi:MAG: 30S ribosomal protein S9 [Parcubacteria group bacterium RIFOXYD2_FULL_52_8]|nr:MAG: 30S ribosomal protein S9 [Parcubacteria group bacterium RIFOXYD2_FULL_52_8]